MAKYHINTKGEPGLCKAIKQCPFGDAEHHYGSREEARAAYEAMAQETIGHITSISPPFDPTAMSLEQLQEFVDQSRANYELVDSSIRDRAENTVMMGRKLDLINPGHNPQSSCDSETFKSLKKDYLEYRNRTADLVDACSNSPYFAPNYIHLDHDSSIGSAIRTSSEVANTEEWLRQRFNTVGGSDVGTLAKNDFTPPEQLMFYDRIALQRTELSKLELPSKDQMAARANLMAGRNNAIYRGTVWEDRIRDHFATSQNDYAVYETKSQFANTNRPWQQVNFDGVLVEKKTGSLGVLECKTSDRPSDWDSGIPINYRAQTLYYMNAANVDYAIVHVVIRDGDFRTYRLNRTDPVVPGVYEGTMDDYISDRVTPWFENLKSLRLQ